MNQKGKTRFKCQNFDCYHNIFYKNIEMKEMNQDSVISDETMNCMMNLKRSYTLEEIGTLWGLSRERVRQIEGKALKKLRLAVKELKGEFNEVM